MANRKHKKKLPTELYVIIICGLLAVAFLLNLQPPISKELPPPNYLGLAQMGVIPSQIQCSHSASSYVSTGIAAQGFDGNQYLILESKFGDESCVVKIK